MTDGIFILTRRNTLALAAGNDVPCLVKYGDTLIQNLIYKLVFVGAIWRAPTLITEVRKLDAALNAALCSDDCNEVFRQYFEASSPPTSPPPTISATQQDGTYTIRDAAWPDIVYRNDLQAIAQELLLENALPTSDLDRFALVLVLPPGTILSTSADSKTTPPRRNSMEGAAAINGQFTLTQSDDTQLGVYFCATVWNDGTNGAAVPAVDLPPTLQRPAAVHNPAWEPWENTCAALYHELGEVRLCPNIDKAPHVKNPCCPPQPGDKGVSDLDLGWLVWYPDTSGATMSDRGGWQEIGDLAVLWAEPLPQKVFCKGHTDTVKDVPIQALWSNELRRPFLPKNFTPQYPGLS
jgi:hypothetical protein